MGKVEILAVYLYQEIKKPLEYVIRAAGEYLLLGSRVSVLGS